MPRVAVNVRGRGSVWAELGETLGEALSRAGLLQLPCAGRGLCGLCRVRVIRGSLSPPTKLEKMFGLLPGERLACQARVEGEVEVEIEETLPKPPHRRGKPLEPRETAPLFALVGSRWVAELGGLGRLELAPGSERILLVDLGTTKTAYQLVAPDGAVLAEDSAFTPLRDFGSDIITRLTKALESQEARLEMKQRLAGLVSGLAHGLGAGAAVVAGNSVMESIFFGMKLEGLASYPFAPERRDPVIAEVEGVPVVGMPMIAGFLGGDAYADLIYALELPLEKPALFVDLGTNAEVFLIGEERVWATSTPSGPAFEEGISRGSGIAVGGVYDIEVAGLEGGRPVFRYRYIKNPAGFLGPALVSLLAELKRWGVLDESGRLVKGYKEIAGLGKVVEVDPERGLFITQRDVREIQKAIAAVKSAVRLLLARSGLTAGDLRSVILAGNFGTSLDISKAIEVGLVPKVEPGRAVAVGNSVLPGMRIALLNRRYLTDYRSVLGRVEFVELPVERGYFNAWVEGLRLKPLE